MDRYEEVVEASFDVEVTALGFAPPPAPLRLRFLRGLPWTLYVHAPGADASDVDAWLRGLEPLSVARNRHGTVHRATVSRFPEAWARAAAHVVIKSAHLEPDGSANVTVDGTRADLRRFAAAFPEPAAHVTLRRLGPPREEAPGGSALTTRQRNVLVAAVREGYYDVPRRTRLVDLARLLGTTPASLSESLRRAEARLVTSYVGTHEDTDGERWTVDVPRKPVPVTPSEWPHDG